MLATKTPERHQLRRSGILMFFLKIFHTFF